MWITRIFLPFCLALAVLLASLAPREPEPTATVPARELLTLAQRAGHTSYTFNQATAAALQAVSVGRPPGDATLAQLESALTEAGFRLRRVGSAEHPTFLVER
jgi:hypothetical protein